MPTEIVGERLGPPIRITSTDEKVVTLLEQIERESYGREASRQGAAPRTWWCSPATARIVEKVLGE
jgi:hypothetical protein